MLAGLKTLLERSNNADPQQLSLEQLQHATAALLVEVATIDQHFDTEELQKLQQLLQQRFALSPEEITSLINTAKTQSSEATSLYEFTQHINALCTPEEKYQLMVELWSIAFADNVLDKYEEHIIRRIADLIHMRHSEFIQSKHEAQEKQKK